jgi:cation:H+ antiporter
VAPLASEFPEFLVAGLLAWRMRPDAALGALVSSTVNQWTLLIGCLPIAYAISSGTINPLPTDSRQIAEVLLTSSMGLMGVVLLVNLRLSLVETSALAILFAAQFLTPPTLLPRLLFSMAFLALAAIFLARQIIDMRRLLDGHLSRPPHERGPSAPGP